MDAPSPRLSPLTVPSMVKYRSCAALIWDHEKDPVTGHFSFNFGSNPMVLPSNDVDETQRPATCTWKDSGPELCPSALHGAINFMFQEYGTPTGRDVRESRVQSICPVPSLPTPPAIHQCDSTRAALIGRRCSTPKICAKFGSRAPTRPTLRPARRGIVSTKPIPPPLAATLALPSSQRATMSMRSRTPRRIATAGASARVRGRCRPILMLTCHFPCTWQVHPIEAHALYF